MPHATVISKLVKPLLYMLLKMFGAPFYSAFLYFPSVNNNLYNLPSNHSKGLTAHKLSSQGFFELKVLASSLMKKV